jgi:TfoX/Sxy family transcriptional regulator of competence genes
MSSELDFVQFVTEQMEDAGNITYRKMFGDYGIYCDGIIFGLICDNQVFLKPTEKGKKFVGEVVEAPPHPGAKNHILIEDKFENKEWISELVKITIMDLQKTKQKPKQIIKKK